MECFERMEKHGLAVQFNELLWGCAFDAGAFPASNDEGVLLLVQTGEKR